MNSQKVINYGMGKIPRSNKEKEERRGKEAAIQASKLYAEARHKHQYPCTSIFNI